MGKVFDLITACGSASAVMALRMYVSQRYVSKHLPVDEVVELAAQARRGAFYNQLRKWCTEPPAEVKDPTVISIWKEGSTLCMHIMEQGYNPLTRTWWDLQPVLADHSTLTTPLPDNAQADESLAAARLVVLMEFGVQLYRWYKITGTQHSIFIEPFFEMVLGFGWQQRYRQLIANLQRVHAKRKGDLRG
jgi:hypothetical protein